MDIEQGEYMSGFSRETLNAMGRMWDDIRVLDCAKERELRTEAKSRTTDYLQAYVTGAEESMGLGKVLYAIGKFFYKRGFLPPNAKLHIYREELQGR